LTTFFTVTKIELIDFETEIAELFNAAKIRAMIHLRDDDGLDQLIEVFKDVKPEDWVLGSWRMHCQCLLKGVPKKLVRAEILAGRSIALCFPEYKVLSSGIVGGVLPIAVGIGMAIKRKGGSEWVHCFLGEMTAETGIAHESMKYARNHDLPVRFIIEDNGLSVCTDTREVWNQPVLTHEAIHSPYLYYKMEKYPHSGAGVRVEF
jgi:TPP-dependent pyruvate/acetoin dehydrogenase alpha subunit